MSLTESCVAAVVVSAVMAVALPAMNRTRQTYALHAAAHDVASRMQFTRITAIVRNRDCRMTVTSASSYVIECDEAPWRVIERVTMPADITVQASARPEFHRRGNVAPTATLTVRNRAGKSKRVIVNVNGRVRIQ